MEPIWLTTMIEDQRWEKLGLEALAEMRGSGDPERHLGSGPDRFEISLLGCNDARIAELNADFRGKPQPTNVLSWPSEERGRTADGGAPDLPRPGRTTGGTGRYRHRLGHLRRGKPTDGQALHDHVTHLIVHGTLHLLGYDHIRDAGCGT